MLHIKYCKDGKAYGDFAVEQQAKNIVVNYLNHQKCYQTEQDLTFNISEETMVLAIRVLIAEGEIPCEQVDFIFGENNPNECCRTYNVDKYGQWIGEQPSFADTTVRCLNVLRKQRNFYYRMQHELQKEEKQQQLQQKLSQISIMTAIRKFSNNRGEF